MNHKRLFTLSFLSVLSAGLVLGSFSFKQKVESADAVGFKTYPNGDGATYYNSIADDLMGNNLLVALRNLNNSKKGTNVGYSAMGTSPSGFFRYTDYDPDTVQFDDNGQPYGTRISSFYTYTSATSWNREHVWPNSHGGGKKGSAGAPYPDQDIHMPRPTITAENSSRGNSFFVEGMNHSSNGWDPYAAGYSELSRGEAARITFYCMTVNANLALSTTNTPPTGGKDPITGNTYSTGNTMGNLETLLKWTVNYEVTQREKNRNEGAEYLQGNRNAFIDHPEYACRIWGDVNDKTRSICSSVLTPVDVEGINFEQSSYDVAINEKLTLNPVISPSNASNKKVTWMIEDSSIATISQTGVVTGVSEGTTTVTATTVDGGFTATCSINVKKVAVTGVTLNHSSLELVVGNSSSLEATVLPSNATNKNVTWGSEDDSVCTVSSSGLVTAVKAGSTRVFVTTVDGEFKAYCNVSVENAPAPIAVTGVTLNKTESELEIGETDYLSATVLPSNAENKAVTWSSSDTSKVSVSSSGLVSAISEGVATVTVATVDGGFTASCQVTVNRSSFDIPVESVSLDKTSITLQIGQASQLTATINPSNATNKDVVWSVIPANGETETCVTVDQNGFIVANSEGHALVTVTTVDGGKKATCAVTVTKEVTPAKTGCGGNVLTSSIILSSLSIVGIGVLLIKRKRFNKQ